MCQHQYYWDDSLKGNSTELNHRALQIKQYTIFISKKLPY